VTAAAAGAGGGTGGAAVEEGIELVCASANPDKAAELADVLATVGIRLAPRPAGLADVVEDGPTLLDNARLKAVAVAEAAGRPAVADDTGLEVEALGGAPGVRTARFAGDDATYADNVTHLLARLAAVGAGRAGQRRARFRTVVLVRWPGGREVLAEGTVLGHIALRPRGGGGFGYDPVFVPDEGGGRTFAEMAPADKHAISHRGRALRALADALRREA
jgi:XTP/dITP diphosphohydrolase